MSDQPSTATVWACAPSAPPTKHQLALMIWIAVFPPTVLNLTIGPWLKDATRYCTSSSDDRRPDRHLG